MYSRGKHIANQSEFLLAREKVPEKDQEIIDKCGYRSSPISEELKEAIPKMKTDYRAYTQPIIHKHATSCLVPLVGDR